MSTTASYNSWAPAKFKGGRNFMRENKNQMREVDKTISGAGISSELPMQPIHSQPPLWRPVQKVYPESRQMRLAQARAFGGYSELKGTEPAVKRCGLYETQQQEINNPMWNAGSTRVQGSNSCVSRMPAAGISYSCQREQEIQTDGINDKQFLAESIRKCKTKGSTVSAGTNTGHDGSGDKSLSARSRSSTTSKRTTVSQTASRRSSVSNRSQASNKTLVGDDNVSVAGSVTGSVAGSTHVNLDDNLDKQSIHSSSISKHSSKSRINSGQDQKRKRHQSHDQSVCCPHCHNKRVEDDSGSMKSQFSTRTSTSNQRERKPQRAQPCKQKTSDFNEEQRMTEIRQTNFNIKTLLEEYNRLPVSAQTFRVRNRKLEIEKLLDELEQNIHRLSYPHLYLQPF